MQQIITNQKQPSRGVLRKRYSENMQHIYRRTRKLRNNFIEITLRHGCSPVNLQPIFTTPFFKNTSGRLLLTNSIPDSDSLTAEIVWTLKCFMYGYSYNSNCDMNEIVKVMFPDSNISNRYQIGADKIKYLVNWGLAPYFKDKLVEYVNKSNFLSFGFEESLNQITQTFEMDITVIFWDVNRVQVRYWDSSFMGHTTANDLLQHFTNTPKPINHSSIIHLSMDGPSVNHKFYRDMKEYREREKLLEMINFGSCNLHILHGAFKSRFESTD